MQGSLQTDMACAVIYHYTARPLFSNVQVTLPCLLQGTLQWRSAGTQHSQGALYKRQLPGHPCMAMHGDGRQLPGQDQLDVHERGATRPIDQGPCPASLLSTAEFPLLRTPEGAKVNTAHPSIALGAPQPPAPTVVPPPHHLQMSHRRSKDRALPAVGRLAAADVAALPDILALLTTADAADLPGALLLAAGRTDGIAAGAIGAVLGALAGHGGLTACHDALAAIGRDGSTPLHAAASSGNSQAVEVLVEAGAPLEAKNTTGSTPLYRAAANNHVAAARVLLAAGASVGATNTHGYTALHTAAGNGHVQMVDILLAKGCAIDAQTADGCTPLMVAAEAGCALAVQRLLQVICADQEQPS